MQVQVHADDSIQGGESLAQWVQEEINSRLARLKDYVQRVEVYLTGVDALKSTGGPGKRCVLETRANGRPPIAVNAEAEKVHEAFAVAVDKLLRAVVGMAASYGGSIVKLVSDTIRSWDVGKVTERVESAVGRDLQYIRINGTLVGGLVGLAIHAVDVWL